MNLKGNMTNWEGDTGRLYEKMIEEIQDYAIIVLDKNGIIQNWNKGAQKIKQYSPGEIIGQHFSIFYLPEDIEAGLPQRLLNQAEYSGSASHEGWRKRRDGSKFWGSITITAIHNDEEEVIGYSKVTRDLTDKKIAEDRLRLSEERYHRMVSEVQDYAIILLDVNGVIENWNAGAEKIKGYKSHEIVGKNFDIFYPDEDRQNGLPQKLLSIARQAGRAIHEGWRIRKDGSKFWGSITITALHSKDGQVIGFSKVTRDLTERKIAEDKLTAYAGELETQNRELEQFAFVASHDLQEPLRKIRTFSGLILENLDDKDNTRKYIAKLDVSAKRMSTLIQSLLDYSRLTKDQLASTPVDLNEILSGVKQDLELTIEESKARIISGPLPTIKGNVSQLGQLFFNLIGNSLKFAQGLPVIKIDWQVVKKNEIRDAPNYLPEGSYYLIRFEDNGIGFDDQYKNLIFSLFQRLHARDEYPGTGIGLTLCKRIVENHNGFITADGEAGKGATFRVYLPV